LQWGSLVIVMMTTLLVMIRWWLAFKSNES
jgi:hypothetical protein